MRPVLDWLREQQVELAIVTNKPERFVAPLLDEKGLGAIFAGLLAATPCPSRSLIRRRCCMY